MHTENFTAKVGTMDIIGPIALEKKFEIFELIGLPKNDPSYFHNTYRCLTCLKEKHVHSKEWRKVTNTINTMNSLQVPTGKLVDLA